MESEEAQVIGSELIAWRMRLALLQKDAAAMLGISVSTLGQYERGVVRRAGGDAVEIPRAVALACSAIAAGLPPYDEIEDMRQKAAFDLVRVVERADFPRLPDGRELVDAAAALVHADKVASVFEGGNGRAYEDRG
jgi:DNA-binding transcriptional regulator YdaS (Cro superfamily)